MIFRTGAFHHGIIRRARNAAGGRLKPPFRSRQEVLIDASLDVVWAFNMDLSKIPEFHPRVSKVDLISGSAARAAGVSYQCHLTGGKHTCIEKDIEIVSMERIVTVLPEDSFGISRILSDYIVETTFQRVYAHTTRMTINHYYSTRSLKAKLFNFVAGRRIARESQATLHAIKRSIEQEATARMSASS